MFRCHVCGQGPEEGVSTYRQNEKGQPGIFACMTHTRVDVDPVVERLVAAIEKKDLPPEKVH